MPARVWPLSAHRCRAGRAIPPPPVPGRNGDRHSVTALMHTAVQQDIPAAILDLVAETGNFHGAAMGNDSGHEYDSVGNVCKRTLPQLFTIVVIWIKLVWISLPDESRDGGYTGLRTRRGPPMLTMLRDLAQYNQEMNKHLYAHLSDMPDGSRKADEGLFFGSIHGTLNHILLVDHLWLARMNSEHYPVQGLDQELYADFAQLRLHQKKADKRTREFVDSLDEGELHRPVMYKSTKGEQRNFPLGRCLTHLFNHQTHHRGQVTAVMSRHGLDYGITDLIFLVGGR